MCVEGSGVKESGEVKSRPPSHFGWVIFFTVYPLISTLFANDNEAKKIPKQVVMLFLMYCGFRTVQSPGFIAAIAM